MLDNAGEGTHGGGVIWILECFGSRVRGKINGEYTHSVSFTQYYIFLFIRMVQVKADLLHATADE